MHTYSTFLTHCLSMCLCGLCTYVHVFTMYVYMYSVYICTVQGENVKWIDEVAVKCQF